MMHSVGGGGWCVGIPMPSPQPTAMFPLPDTCLGLVQHNGSVMLWGVTRVHQAVRARL